MDISFAQELSNSFLTAVNADIAFLTGLSYILQLLCSMIIAVYSFTGMKTVQVQNHDGNGVVTYLVKNKLYEIIAKLAACGLLIGIWISAVIAISQL